MHKRWLILSVVIFASLLSHAAWAAPPASCAGKFVGTWTYPGGTTVVNRDGTANPLCSQCVSVQTWTCNGNTYLFSNGNSPGDFTATLIAPNVMQGSGVTATRAGGSPAAAPAAAAKPVATASPRRDTTDPEPTTRGTIPDGCLVTTIKPSVIACEAGGVKGIRHSIDFTVKKGARCPKDFQFSYKDPNSGQTQTWAVPIQMHMCGNHAINAKIVQPR